MKKIIRTQEEYEETLRKIDRLWGAEPETAEAALLDELVERVVDYEEDVLGPPLNSPADALLAHMDMTARSMADIVSVVGSVDAAMEILQGRRVIGGRLAAKFEDRWDIPLMCLMGEIDPET